MTTSAKPEPGSMEYATSAVEGLLSPKGDKEKPAAKPPAKPASAEHSEDTSSESTDEQAPAEDAEQTDESAETTETADEADESASTETSTEDASDEASESQEEPDEQAAAPTRAFKVKIAGKEREVTERELIDGYMRDADYRQKTMALAESRKKLETDEIVPLRAARAKYEENLTKIEAALQEAYPKEPNWQELREKLTPEEFSAELLGWQQREKNMAAVKAEQQRIADEKAAEEKTAMQAYVAEQEDLLLKALPAWKKPEVAEKEQKELTAFAHKLGFSSQELRALRDHRLVLLLRSAMLYDRGVAKKPAIQNKIQQALETTAPKGGPTKAAKSKEQQARGRLAKSGDIADAADAVEARLFG